MADPELSFLREALDVVNLAGVLQTPDVKFTVSGLCCFFSSSSSDAHFCVHRNAPRTTQRRRVSSPPQLFAPTNEAWDVAAANLGQTRSQLLSSRNALRDIIFQNLVPNTPLPAAAVAKSPAMTPQGGQPIYVQASAEGPTRLVSVGSTATVTAPDYAIACNYVIHKTDALLLPVPAARGGINPQYQSAQVARPPAAAPGGR